MTNTNYAETTTITLVLRNGEHRYQTLAEGQSRDAFIADSADYHGENLARAAFTTSLLNKRTGMVEEITTSWLTTGEVAELVDARKARKAAERQARIENVRRAAAAKAGGQ